MAKVSVTRLVTALRQHRGVVAKVARTVGLSRQRVYEQMAEQDLHPDDFRDGEPSRTVKVDTHDRHDRGDMHDTRPSRVVSMPTRGVSGSRNAGGSSLEAVPSATVSRVQSATLEREAATVDRTPSSRLRIRKQILFAKEDASSVDNGKRLLAAALGRDLEFSDVIGMLIKECLPAFIETKTSAKADRPARAPRKKR